MTTNTTSADDLVLDEARQRESQNRETEKTKGSPAADLFIENRSQRMTDEVADALAMRRSAHLKVLAIGEENDFTPEQRRETVELRRRMAHAMSGGGLNEKLEGALRDSALRKSTSIADILADRIEKQKRAWLTSAPKWGDINVTLPRPVDHSFWWAETSAHVAPDTRAEFRDDGLHFWGGPKVNDYDGEMHTSLGAVASFTLQPDRFPTSPSGMFRSSPRVELFGGVVAYAPDWDLIQGNGIAECKLFLRQSIFQFGFGPTGPAPMMIAEAKSYDAWQPPLYLKNTGYSRHADMPGSTAVPAVTFSQGQLAPNDLHAEIEFRLDIYLNCTGALVWCDPEVLVRTFQWAPVPLP